MPRMNAVRGGSSTPTRSTRLAKERELTRLVLEKTGYFRIKAREKSRRGKFSVLLEDLSPQSSLGSQPAPPTSDTICDVVRKPGVMDLRFREEPAVRAEIEAKAARTAVLFNKGGYGYVTDFDGTKYLGKK